MRHPLTCRTADMQSTLQTTGTDTLQFAPQTWLPRGYWSAGKGSCKRLVCSPARNAPRPSFFALDAGDACCIKSLVCKHCRYGEDRDLVRGVWAAYQANYPTELRALTKLKNPLVTSGRIASEGGRRGGSGHTVPRSTSQHRIPGLNSSLDRDPRFISCIEVCNPITHEALLDMNFNNAPHSLFARDGSPVGGTHNQPRGRRSLQTLEP